MIRSLIAAAALLIFPTLAGAAPMTVDGGNLNVVGSPSEALSGTVDLTGMLLDVNVYTSGYVTNLAATDLAVSWFDADTLQVNALQYGSLNGDQVRLTGACDVLSGGNLRCNLNIIGTTTTYRGTISGLTASVVNGAAAIPEPVSTALLGAGALIVGAFVRRREATC